MSPEEHPQQADTTSCPTSHSRPAADPGRENPGTSSTLSDSRNAMMLRDGLPYRPRMSSGETTSKPHTFSDGRMAYGRSALPFRSMPVDVDRSEHTFRAVTGMSSGADRMLVSRGSGEYTHRKSSRKPNEEDPQGKDEATELGKEACIEAGEGRNHMLGSRTSELGTQSQERRSTDVDMGIGKKPGNEVAEFVVPDDEDDDDDLFAQSYRAASRKLFCSYKNS
ncbi:uncharacterized protein EI97DRAFT_445169 [Westerdykella ornata]|uniref:Uncharacterized protein n=1 Tax=Westerdykella ornata TaxID=318751 RepID=A0A6A6JA62_WESOR|nr:uncharacterized protein EI97DRAFT_445169 [Westerdykella ornata]KAF2273063.1 hypothetical protein EI97DRAFT_445169 [Westerdykella ornata]